MTEKKRTLLIIIAAVVLLGIAMFFLLKDDEKEIDISDSPAVHEHETNENFIENVDGELLIDKESSDVKSVVLTNSHGKITILRDESTASLYIKELDRNIPLSEDFLEYVWYYAYCLGYNYKIISSSDMPVSMSDFGLDEPSASFSVKYTDDTVAEFDIGDSLVSSENVYYVNFHGFENTVFITEMSIAAFQSENYFIDPDFFYAIDQDAEVEIGKIEITGSRIPKKITIKPYSSEDRSDQSYGHSHILSSPVKGAVNDVNATALVNELTYLAADSVVCTNPDKKQLKEYGLNDPSLIISFERNGKKQVLSIGNTDNSTYCYAMLKGIDVIYNIDPLQVEAILSSSLSFYRSTELRLFRINAVESVTVSFEDESYTFDATRTPLSEGSDEYYEYHVFYNDKEMSIDNYRDFLAVISGANAVNWETSAVSDESALTIRVNYFDSFERDDDVLRFYEGEYTRYVCSINGTKTANVPAVFLSRVMNASRNLAADKPIAD